MNEFETFEEIIKNYVNGLYDIKLNNEDILIVTAKNSNYTLSAYEKVHRAYILLEKHYIWAFNILRDGEIGVVLYD